MMVDLYLAPIRNGPPYRENYTREEWLRRVLTGEFKPKPPAWWIRSQEDIGRTGSTAYAIWHRNYKPERKYIIWDQAPEEDWRELGYLL